jgi:hypothetical protein
LVVAAPEIFTPLTPRRMKTRPKIENLRRRVLSMATPQSNLACTRSLISGPFYE